MKPRCCLMTGESLIATGTGRVPAMSPHVPVPADRCLDSFNLPPTPSPTGSLNSIGRLARRGGSKRRRLEPEVPVAVPADNVGDDADGEESDEEWLDAGLLDRHQAQAEAQAVGPFGTLHESDHGDDDTLAEADGPVSKSRRGLDGMGTGWWPRALLWGRPRDTHRPTVRAPRTPSPASHHRPATKGPQGTSSAASRVGQQGCDGQGGDTFGPQDAYTERNGAVAVASEQSEFQLLHPGRPSPRRPLTRAFAHLAACVPQCCFLGNENSFQVSPSSLQESRTGPSCPPTFS